MILGLLAGDFCFFKNKKKSHLVGNFVVIRGLMIFIFFLNYVLSSFLFHCFM